jgi:hypothetical protein|nr:MAG TPA: hypothetical protein [Caudoviricetes sp.]
MLNLMKKKTANEKTAIQITPSQKATTTVANVAGKVKTGAFGVATGAGIAGTMMLQNEKGIRNRKAREAYHKRVEQVCTVAVGAAIVGAGAAVVQSIFDPIVDVSMLEIEPAAYVELNDKGSEIQEAREAAQNSNAAEHVEDEGAAEDDKAGVVPEQNAEQPAEKVVAEIVQTEQPASAPKVAEKPIVEATATEVQTEAPADPAPVAPAAEQPTPAEKTPTAPAEQNHVDPNAGKPADSASAAQTNQGDNAQQPKSKTGKQQPKDNGQNGNNKNANAAK